MDSNVKDEILSQPRAKELAKWEPPQPSLKELRAKFGGPGVSDDELLLRYLAGRDQVEAMRAAGPHKEYLNARHPLVTLIGELTKLSDYRQIFIRKGSLSLQLEKREG